LTSDLNLTKIGHALLGKNGVRFTDLLWAVFQIMEELGMREESLEHLPEADYLHRACDVKRAYSHIAIEWLAYALHLKGELSVSLLARSADHSLQSGPVSRCQRIGWNHQGYPDHSSFK
jgi:hypothetical protein